MLAIEMSISAKIEYETSIKSIDLCHKLHVQYFCGLSTSDGKGQKL